MTPRLLPAAAAVTVALAALPPAASAWENPGQTPVTDSMLVEALDPAARYWQRTTDPDGNGPQKGQTPCNPELFMYDAHVAHPDPDGDGPRRGLAPGERGAEATFPSAGHCAIWFDRTTWALLSQYLFGSANDLALGDNEWAAKMIGQLTTHERGHNLGYLHSSPLAIMDGTPALYTHFAPEVEAWAATSPWRRNHAIAPPTPDVEGANAPRPRMTVSDRMPSARVARLVPRVRKCQRARYRREHRASCARVVRQYRAAKAATR